MPDYRWDNEDLQKKLQGIIDDEGYEELANLREHPPVIKVAEVFYADDDLFDRAQKRKLGGVPVRILKVNDTFRSLTSGNGILKGHNPEAKGVDFIVKVDPAVLKPYPDHAKTAFLFDVLCFLRLRTEQDSETGETIPVVKDGRPVWEIARPQSHTDAAIRHFGRFDESSKRLLEAAQMAGERQLNLLDWKAELPEEPEDPEGGEAPPRDVGEEEPEATE